MRDTFEATAAAAREELGERAGGTLIGDGDPRFELYHFGFSICSQKVRTVLSEKGVTWRSHELNPTENFRPHYVRLRLHAAGPALRERLASAHTMRSSVASEGFDACVVPTLVDLHRQRAVVDSAAILDYIENEVSSPVLVPADIADGVREQVRIIDTLPHPGLLYGFAADDRRPAFWRAAMEGVYDRKCAALEALIAAHRDDAELVRAWRAKIAKEQAGKALQKDTACMAALIEEVRGCIDALDRHLRDAAGAWICGDAFSLADCVWGVSLYRLHWLGRADLWRAYRAVSDYATRLYAHPSLRRAVIEWPSDMPSSPHTADIDGTRGATSA